jgi:glycosyltransferase involved in cell wall biosynthesis
VLVLNRVGRISIAIPFFNARRTLADAVRSVFAQSYSDWELILVDDGSSDGSTELVQQIDDPRIRVVSDGVNRGLSARLNQIATLATGEYLARMDADDLMHPDRIAKQCAFLDANPNVDAIDTTTYTVDDDLTPLGVRGEEPLDCRPEAILRHGLFIHPTMMGRSQWFRKNPYDGHYVRAEDRELWCRTCTTSQFARLSEPLFFYREGLAGNLRNYISTGATISNILRQYGPPLIGSWRTSLLIGQFSLRTNVYRAATALGMQGRIIRRRNRSLTGDEQQRATNVIEKIRSISLPGLSSERVPEGALV